MAVLENLPLNKLGTVENVFKIFNKVCYYSSKLCF